MSCCHIRLAAAAMALALAGCIEISETSTGDFGFKDRFAKSTREIVARSREAEQAALQGRRASLDAKTEQYLQRHFAKADELVAAHMNDVKRALRGNFFASFNDFNSRRSVLLDFTMELKPSLDVVESRYANAMAFPSGKVVLNRPLAEAFDVNRDGFDDVLLGILVHELVHVRDGHALEQWATVDSRQAWARDKFLGAVSGITALIPFLSIKYDIQYPTTFGATRQLPALSEYAADMGAVRILDRAGYDSGRYIAFLREMSANTASAAPENAPRLLRQRVECLANFARDSFKPDMLGVVIGSTEEGDGIVQTLDLRVTYKAAALLDSPEELAKAFPGKPPITDAERRGFVLLAVRNTVYTGCAIRQSFPDAKLDDGVLTTPSFDLAMFTQHY